MRNFAAKFITFFIRHTNTPETGPIVNAASIAGTSEKSSLMKLGITGISNFKSSASTMDSAAISAENTSRLTSNLFVVLMFSIISSLSSGEIGNPFTATVRL